MTAAVRGTEAGPYELAGTVPRRRRRRAQRRCARACGIGFPGVTDRGLGQPVSGRVVIDRRRSRRPIPASWTCREPGRLAAPARSPAPRTGCSPSGCSSRECTWCRCSSGVRRPLNARTGRGSRSRSTSWRRRYWVLGVAIPVTAPPEGPEARRTTAMQSARPSATAVAACSSSATPPTSSPASAGRG